jgi:DNA (cytosine-5)-methyltransferase 1
MLASLGQEGYSVEWRVVNAADYGFPQRRRRVLIVAYKTKKTFDPETILTSGILAAALPVTSSSAVSTGSIDTDLLKLSREFGKDSKVSAFRTAGFYQNGRFQTLEVESAWEGTPKTLGDILLDFKEVPKSYLIDLASLPKWKYLKGAKSEERTHSSGYKWRYTEGSMVFPDPTDKPSRTILTGEGGVSPSRFKHVVKQSGKLRRLHPIELERLNGFPDNWTSLGDSAMPDARRAFFMGNALVVGLIESVGKVIAQRLIDL